MAKTKVEIPENEVLYINAGPTGFDSGYRYDFEVYGETVGPLIVSVSVKGFSVGKSNGVFKISGFFNPDDEQQKLCDMTYCPHSKNKIKGMIYNIRKFYRPMLAASR
ncbi:MAG: hypothetical protein HYX21_03575 [Candidatus Yanofskybacteria bacterium]|nr:hypothetical protein [Candidatus Yanofskybacteria bacterium]